MKTRNRFRNLFGIDAKTATQITMAQKSCVILASAVGLICFSWAPMSFAQSRANSDYCASTGRIIAFLVDVTTPYDETDKNIIVRTAEGILSSVRGGDKLIIRTIADSHVHSERLIERCIPYCPETSTFGHMFKCSDGLIRTDSQLVRSEIIEVLRQRLSKFEELQYSDIVRTVSAVATEAAKPDRPFILYIYSDLIENSDYFSSRYLFSYSIPRLIYGLQYYKQIANLKDAEVHVTGVGRAGTSDRRPLSVTELNKLIDFWRAYFKQCGAKEIEIAQDRIENKK